MDVEFLKRALRARHEGGHAHRSPQSDRVSHGSRDIARHRRSRASRPRHRAVQPTRSSVFIEQDASYRLPRPADQYDRAVSVGGLSKTRSACLACASGWAATRDRELLARMARVKDYLSLCNGAVDESLAGIALRNRAALHARSLAIINANLQHPRRVLPNAIALRCSVGSGRGPAPSDSSAIAAAKGPRHSATSVVRSSLASCCFRASSLEFGERIFAWALDVKQCLRPSAASKPTLSSLRTADRASSRSPSIAAARWSSRIGQGTWPVPDPARFAAGSEHRPDTHRHRGDVRRWPV